MNPTTTGVWKETDLSETATQPVDGRFPNRLIENRSKGAFMKSAVTTVCLLLFCIAACIRSTTLHAGEFKYEDDLVAVKAALDKEYQALSELRTELEQARQLVKTAKDLAAYQKRLEVYDRKITIYDEKRRDYDERVRAIADAEAQKQAIIDNALSDYEGYPVGMTEAPTTEEESSVTKTDEPPAGDAPAESAADDQKAPDEPSDTPEEVQTADIQTVGESAGTEINPAKSARALQAEQKILEKRKNVIDEDYKALMKEKDAIDSRRKPRMSINEINALNKDVGALNEKIQQFEGHRKQFEKEVGDYNKRVNDAGLSENQQPEPTGAQ